MGRDVHRRGRGVCRVRGVPGLAPGSRWRVEGRSGDRARRRGNHRAAVRGADGEQQGVRRHDLVLHGSGVAIAAHRCGVLGRTRLRLGVRAQA